MHLNLKSIGLDQGRASTRRIVKTTMLLRYYWFKRDYFYQAGHLLKNDSVKEGVVELWILH